MEQYCMQYDRFAEDAQNKDDWRMRIKGVTG